ncbi:MAG: 2-oxo acid dehydrogenase subunit E2, partial [Bacteroidales bacterium]|nr:2-oxo acid dehydrogenase subunit E2 [Bacteroidales bacterium]
MSKFELVIPKLGESVQEATIIKWFVKEGDKIDEDDLLLEIGTDKVDSEIPSPVEGFITKIFFSENELIPVGTVIAHISMDGDESESESKSETAQERPQNKYTDNTK